MPPGAREAMRTGGKVVVGSWWGRGGAENHLSGDTRIFAQSDVFPYGVEPMTCVISVLMIASFGVSHVVHSQKSA